ncbi:MAG TPA: ATP-binding protein, partial [bacterium]|nr:ATP-binding protein [bacterium]
GGIIEFTARNLTISEKEHPVLEHGKYVKMSIKDSGIGIPKELLSRIFDPFFTTKPKGHGLGLATCYSIINRHGGCIDVESEQGKGSTFHIYIPASSEPALMPFGSESLQHTGSGTILVMDDEEIIGDIVSNMLQSFGYKVVYKMNGKEIINFLKTEKEASRDIAAMIFDLTIPGGMGGKETIKEVRKMNIQIPAFVASGYAEDPVMANPLKYGFTASICKPFKIIDLMRMLNTHLKQ